MAAFNALFETTSKTRKVALLLAGLLMELVVVAYVSVHTHNT